MREHVDYDELGAVVISHMHADHFLDLVPLRYALVYGARRRADRLPLWLPPGGASMLRLLTSAFLPEPDGDFLDGAFAIEEFDPGRPLTLGASRLHFARTTHYIPSYAIRVEREGTSLTYSADTAPDAAVVDLARGTDLFLCEATLGANDVEPGTRGHSSAREAGEMARAAGAKRLVLTHYPETAGPRDLVEGARAVFGTAVDAADDGEVYTL